VTLAVPTFRERYFADLAEAVVSAARERSTTVLVETTGGRQETELELLRGGGEILTDGVIMSAVSLGRTDQRSTHPVVLIGDREPGSAIDHVGIKNREAAQAAVTHLLDSGRRRILLLGANHGPKRSYQLRRQGYQAALKKHGIAPDPDLLVDCDWTTAAAADAVTTLLAERALPGATFAMDGTVATDGTVTMDGTVAMDGISAVDGIFAMNDSAALGALRALVRAGIDVPGQVSVIGFDDIVEAGLSTPSLSTVAPLLDDIASMALDLLAEQFGADDSRVPQHRMAGYELRVRESTGR
jgi:DNA-binding LacI/PurR family transcriptional regulator